MRETSQQALLAARWRMGGRDGRASKRQQHRANLMHVAEPPAAAAVAADGHFQPAKEEETGGIKTRAEMQAEISKEVSLQPEVQRETAWRGRGRRDPEEGERKVGG